MMEFHEAANLFPLMEGKDFDALVADIKSNGLREAIWTYGEKIIDGRNRYKACGVAGVEPKFREWDGHGSLVAFVVSLNLHRRHLTTSQRAMIAAKIVNTSKHGGGDKKSDHHLNLDGDPEVTVGIAAGLLNVSKSNVSYARAIKNEADPQLAKAVDEGCVTVNEAYAMLDRPREEQQKVASRGRTLIRPRQNKNGNGTAATKTKTHKGRKAPEAIRGAIGTLVGLSTGLDSFTVKDAAPTAEEVEEWEKELSLVISAINRFRRQLKECGHV